MPIADRLSFLGAWRARLSDVWADGPLRVVAAVAGLAVAAVAAVLWLRPPSLPPPEVVLPTVPPGGAGGPSAGSVEPSVVVVHAAGAVARPGVYRLPGGARVADVVEAAGGSVGDADLDRLNLAAKVGDGQRVYVPRRGEPLPDVEVAAGGGAADGTGSAAGPVDLNTASAAELEELPGIGPATARAIVEHRSRHGPFRSVDDLLSVRGIGPAKLAELRALVTVSR